MPTNHPFLGSRPPPWVHWTQQASSSGIMREVGSGGAGRESGEVGVGRPSGQLLCKQCKLVVLMSGGHDSMIPSLSPPPSPLPLRPPTPPAFLPQCTQLPGRVLSTGWGWGWGLGGQCTRTIPLQALQTSRCRACSPFYCLAHPPPCPLSTFNTFVASSADRMCGVFVAGGVSIHDPSGERHH